MSALVDFAPGLTTITTTFTALGNRPVTLTFTEDPDATAGFNLFPPGPPFLSSIPYNAGCAQDGQLPGLIGTLCNIGTASATNPPSTPPPLSTTHPTPESTGLTSSQSSRESTSTPTSADSTTQGSSSTSTISIVPSDPGSPVASFSTASNATPTPIEPSPAALTRSSGLSVGSAVGITLGVFAGASILVAAALFLFLFLRKRKRRRNRDSMTRELTSSEGSPSPSRVLSSTWSWFGSLAIGPEPDPIPEYKHGRRASLRAHDDICHTMVSGKVAPPDPAAAAVHKVAHALNPPFGHESSEDTAAHLLALAGTEYSTSGLPFRSTLAGARAENASERSERGRGGDDIEAQGARDPFADPHLSGISHASMSARSGEVESVEAQ